MTAFDALTDADRDAIARQIADGAAPLDSWSQQAAGGYMRPDDAREYFCHLPSAWTGDAGPRRVARVTAYRSPDGSRWTIGDVDVFAAAVGFETVRGDDGRAADILAAVDADPRRIRRTDDPAYVAATTPHDFYQYDE